MQQLDQRRVIADVGIVRRELQRTGDIGERFVETSEPVEQKGAAGEGLREVRVQPDRRRQIRDGIVVPIGEQQRDPAGISGGDVAVVERDGALEALDRLIAAL